MSIKIDNMENARKAKKEKAEHKKSKKLTSEQQMEEDLKQILRVESISKKLFGNVDTLSNFENTWSKLGDAVILTSRASSNGLNFFRVIFSFSAVLTSGGVVSLFGSKKYGSGVKGFWSSKAQWAQEICQFPYLSS